MFTKISSVFLLLGAIAISTIHAVELPGNYTVPPNSDNVCFAARFDLILNVEYTKFDGKKNLTRIPLNNETFAGYSGTCSFPKSHTLTINLLNNLTSITFDFALDDKNQTSLKRVFGSITVDERSNDFFPNYTANVLGLHVFFANESLFAADLTHSYRCNSKTKIDNFKTDEKNLTVKSIDIENLRIQPFADIAVTFHDYAAEKVCTMDYFRPSTLVPIIVGVCLALLVVGVLVAYLIGRRRNRNGYQSV